MFRKILIAFMWVLLSTGSQAALFDRGGGMIYDSVLDITWLQDANQAGIEMDWEESVAWADGLSYGGYDDWRLASMDVNGDHMATGDLFNGIVDCSTASEMACRDNELGYMFYYNLMGSSGDNLTGDQGLFTNIQNIYWAGEEFAPDPSRAWYFVFDVGGGQSYAHKIFNSFDGAWAVRAGDVAVVPLPAGIWLLGSALLGVVGLRRR